MYVTIVEKLGEAIPRTLKGTPSQCLLRKTGDHQSSSLTESGIKKRCLVRVARGKAEPWRGVMLEKTESFKNITEDWCRARNNSLSTIPPGSRIGLSNQYQSQVSLRISTYMSPQSCLKNLSSVKDNHFSLGPTKKETVHG
jgi:hypothetical protein